MCIFVPSMLSRQTDRDFEKPWKANCKSRGMRSRKSKIRTPDLSTPQERAALEDRALRPDQKRLLKGFLSLQDIDHRRANGECSFFDWLVEQRIIWREILELELQSLRGHIRSKRRNGLRPIPQSLR